MFDLGWSKLLIVAIIAIVVVGPKELPALLRTLGADRRQVNLAILGEFGALGLLAGAISGLGTAATSVVWSLELTAFSTMFLFENIGAPPTIGFLS